MLRKSMLLKSALIAMTVVAGVSGNSAKADWDDWRGYGNGYGYGYRQWERHEAREAAEERYEAAVRRAAWLRHERWEHRGYYTYRRPAEYYAWRPYR